MTDEKVTQYGYSDSDHDDDDVVVTEIPPSPTTPQRLSVPAFFKLRPANFPTIRLSQLAALYAKHATVFKLLITLNSIVQIREVLSVKASEYWSTHYTFGTALKASSKVISNSFVF